MTAILGTNCSAANSDPSAGTDHPDRAHYLRSLQFQDHHAERRLHARLPPDRRSRSTIGSGRAWTRFTIRQAGDGGTAYDWLSGPNKGYGFGSSGTPNRSVEEHREGIRAFLAMINPNTGYIGDD